jgi:hypothetical protein
MARHATPSTGRRTDYGTFGIARYRGACCKKGFTISVDISVSNRKNPRMNLRHARTAIRLPIFSANRLLPENRRKPA